MLTKRQVLAIERFYIIPLFNTIAPMCSIDESEGLTSGHCYYFAKKLNEFLQGKWKYRDISSLTEEEIEQRRIETGKISSIDDSHYFVEYNGDFFDGEGAMEHDKFTVTIWGYENGHQSGCTDKRRVSINKLDRKEYGDPDGSACFCMNYYKSAVWDIYDLVFKPFEKEMIAKLEKYSEEGNDVGFDATLNIYASESHKLLENDPDTINKVKEIKENLFKKDKEISEQNRKWAEEHKEPLKEYEITINGKRKSVRTWGNLSEEEYKEYIQSEEFKKRLEKRFKI